MLSPSPMLNAERPTGIRYAVVATMMLMSLLLYLDRFCLSFAERLIKQDLSMTNEQISHLFSAFFVAYAIGQVPSGWFSDWLGARVVLSLYILFWSLFTGLSGLAGGFAVLFVLRLGFGLAQAGAYPTAASSLSRWFPFAQRGLASGLVASGGRLGLVLAPLLTGYLIVLLVPPSTASEIQVAELVDPAGLCRKLTSPEDSKAQVAAVSRRVYQAFPNDIQRLVDQCASAGNMDVAHVEELANGLKHPLAIRNLYDAASMAELPLEEEARRILKQPREEWTLDQTQRVNRLILEAAFPDYIKKIYVAGWRPALIIYGLAGALVTALFWLVFRNRPEQHPACNTAEVALIQYGRPTASTRPLTAAPLKRLMHSGSMWLCSISQAGTNIGWVFLGTWLPRYLQEVHQVPVETRGWMVAIPPLVGWIGMVLGGPLTDFTTRRFGIRWGRALPMGLTRFLAMAAFLFCLLPLDDWIGPYATPWILTAAFAVVAFGTDLGVAAVWAFNQDVGGRHVGSVLGWGNMWGNLGAAISPPLLNYVVGPTGRWDLAFLVCAGSFLIAGLAALGVDATKPIVPEEE